MSVSKSWCLIVVPWEIPMETQLLSLSRLLPHFFCAAKPHRSRWERRVSWKQNHGSLRTGFPMDSDLPHGVASIIHQHPRTSMNYINQKGFRTVLLWLENGLTERIPISEWTLDSCIQMAEHKVIKTYRSPMLIQQSFNMMLIQMIWISAAKKRFVTNKQLLLFAKSNSQKKTDPLVNKHSCWKSPFIVRFPIKNGDFP